jgi:Ni,Fe-hydrogenase III small subunit
MANWVLKGLRTGVKTGGYPQRAEDAPGITPGRPIGTGFDAARADALSRRCPTGAIVAGDRGIAVTHAYCVHCFRCRDDNGNGHGRGDDAGGAAAGWEQSYEWAAPADGTAAAQQELARIFGRSLHVRFVDAGACGACISEARQLNNPYYNMHRLGLFVTPTPRNADVLLVAGPVSDAMRLPLRKVYDAMPPPKRVIAIGVCAISGGVFGPSFAALGGAQEVIPVDVVVPGCPPPPLAILHGLLVLVARKPPVPLVSLPP